MFDFIDITPENKGTPINRYALMAIQGFIGSNVRFNADGSIVQTNEDGQTLTTVFLPDGSVSQTFVGEKTITKVTTFSSSGIEEVII